ncbi:MAG TPA: agmatinase family protein [Conexibacter sp.]|nr:agmatinase family protein [Conexibacter sp.]
MQLTPATHQLLVPPTPLRAAISDPHQCAVADLVTPYRDDAEHSALLLGVPFDTTTLGRAGSRHAPRAIRDALAGLLGFDADTGTDLSDLAPVGDLGDVDVLHTDVDATWDRITSVTRELAAHDAPLVVLGGDHGLTFPVLRGLVADGGRRLGVVNLDAHYDLRPSYHGQPASGVPFRYALERLDGAIRGESCTHIGVTGWANSHAAAAYADRVGLRAFSGAELRSGSLEQIVTEAVARGTTDTDGLWISVDIDVVDGAFAPGTSSPTIGGIDSRELLRLVHLLAQAPQVVGIDVVEVAPQYDVSGITAKLAAVAVVTFLAARHAASASKTEETGDSLPAATSGEGSLR